MSKPFSKTNTITIQNSEMQQAFFSSLQLWLTPYAKETHIHSLAFCLQQLFQHANTLYQHYIPALFSYPFIYDEVALDKLPQEYYHDWLHLQKIQHHLLLLQPVSSLFNLTLNDVLAILDTPLSSPKVKVTDNSKTLSRSIDLTLKHFHIWQHYFPHSHTFTTHFSDRMPPPLLSQIDTSLYNLQTTLSELLSIPHIPSTHTTTSTTPKNSLLATTLLESMQHTDSLLTEVARSRNLLQMLGKQLIIKFNK